MANGDDSGYDSGDNSGEELFSDTSTDIESTTDNSFIVLKNSSNLQML